MPEAEKQRQEQGREGAQFIMHDIETLAIRLDRIEESLRLLLKERVEQRFYSTSDAAKILGKAEFTVREWCRNRRVRAQKRPCGRGNSKEWMIAHDELERIKAEGLLERNEANSTA